MNKFMYKMSSFFQGRYGIDQLFYGFCGVAVVLSVVNLFARSMILQLIVYAIFILAVIRAMSRNKEKRYAENQKFSGVWDKMKNFGNAIKGKFHLYKRVFKDRKTHCYVKCSSCKKILRLPKKKGIHTVSCPNCHDSFQVKI